MSRIGQRVPFNQVQIGEYVKFDNNDASYKRIRSDDHLTLEIYGRKACCSPTSIIEITIVDIPEWDKKEAFEMPF